MILIDRVILQACNLVSIKSWAVYANMIHFFKKLPSFLSRNVKLAVKVVTMVSVEHT